MNVTISGARWANLNGSHGNHYAHQALMNVWKNLAILAIRQQRVAGQRFAGPVVVTATVRRTTNGKADAHNVTPTIKACIDAAVHCGVLDDDHDGIVRELRIKAGPKAAKPTIELHIEAAP